MPAFYPNAHLSADTELMIHGFVGLMLLSPVVGKVGQFFPDYPYHAD